MTDKDKGKDVSFIVRKKRGNLTTISAGGNSLTLSLLPSCFSSFYLLTPSVQVPDVTMPVLLKSVSSYQGSLNAALKHNAGNIILVEKCEKPFILFHFWLKTVKCRNSDSKALQFVCKIIAMALINSEPQISIISIIIIIVCLGQ